MIADATGVTIYHRMPDGGSAASAWWSRLRASAAAAAGFVDALLATPEPFAGQPAVAETTVLDTVVLDPATAVTFTSEDDLHAWLDGAERARLLAEGAALGVHRKCADLILLDGSAPPTGVGIFQHTVAAGKAGDFLGSQRELVRLSAGFPGFEGATLLPPGPVGEQWLSILRFRTDRQLQAWLQSAERRAALPELRAQLTEDFSVVTHSTPFGSILRVQDGTTRVTPQWKTAMLVLLVLYPTVMTLSRFLGPVLDELGAEPWLSMWLSQIVSVGLMTWFLMPAVTGWFRQWLDPVDGAGLRVGLAGAGIVLVVYAATLGLFASVTWLQFWDYLD